MSESNHVANLAAERDHYADMVTAEWPEALVKAFADEFDYALGLRDGSVIFFASARPSRCRGWVHLVVKEGRDRSGGVVFGPVAESGAIFDRGVDVRLSEIAWVADAPDGS